MKIFIKLEIEDINTVPIGGNVGIRPVGGIIEEIIFSQEAALELLKDLPVVLKMAQDNMAAIPKSED